MREPQADVSVQLQALTFAARREAAEFERLLAMLPSPPPKPGLRQVA
jgi:hypothetical protein